MVWINLNTYKDISTGIETISYENVNISYPEHTHIGHLVFGIVTEGKVGVKIDQEEFVCNEGEMFSIALEKDDCYRGYCKGLIE